MTTNNKRAAPASTDTTRKNTATSDTCDYITVLETVGDPLTTFYQDGQRWINDAFNGASLVRECPVENLSDVASLLGELHREPLSCIVQGAYVGDGKAKRTAKGLIEAGRANFKDCLGRLLILEVGWDTEGIDPVTAPEEAILQFIDRVLPEPFQDASFVWRMCRRSEHTGKRALKAHLVFWLERPMKLSELDKWRESVGLVIKPASCKPGHPIFTAGAMLEDGTIEPSQNRYGYCKAGSESVALLSGERVAQKINGIDRLTVLETFGPCLTKTYKSDGTTDSYSDAASFKHKVVEVANLRDLATLLGKLHPRSNRSIIRGTPKAEMQPGNVHGSVTRTNANFDDQPLHSFVIDIDGYRPGFADPVLETELAVQDFLAEKLPPCFKTASFYWHLSSSAGMPGKEGILKCHLWMWSKTAYTTAQMYEWAKGFWPAIDKAVYRRIQHHYVADPIFEEGRTDPVPVRSGWHQGETDYVDLVITQDTLAQAREQGSGESGNDMKLVDPSEKSGLIGLYNKVFTAEEVLLVHLEGEFEAVSERRYTWLNGGGTPEGVWVHDDGMHVGSSHNTWPIDGIANLWDLVRVFKFGHLDESDDDFVQEDIDSQPINAKPSNLAMLDWAGKLPELLEAAIEERSSEGVIKKLRLMSREGVLKEWVKLALPLSSSDSQEVTDEVSRLTGRGKRPLSSDLSKARKEIAKKKAKEEAAARIAGRETISYQPENRTIHAEQVEDLILKSVGPGEYLNFSGLLSQVTLKTLPYTHLIDNAEDAPPAVPQIEALGKVAVLSLVERVAVFCDFRTEVPQLIAVPDSIIDILINKTEHLAPTVTGLVTHPIVLGNGEIVSKDGLHDTGLFLSGSSMDCGPFDQKEAAHALQRLRMNLLEGFEFASDLDADAAIAGLMTGVQRKVLDSAPGLAILAASQSSGKTTLARRIHIMLTGRDMPVSTFPDSEEEVQKRLLSLLLRSPAMICFDNITDGFTFRSAAIAGAMTAPALEQRILGQSKDVHALTNVFFTITGNNLRLGKDEVTRWLVSHLSPANARPYERKFTHPDVVSHALAMREEVLKDVVGIIAGYLLSNDQIAPHSRYPRWDKFVRQSLIWAGGYDVASIFEKNETSSEDAQALQSLLTALREFFMDGEFKAWHVAALIASPNFHEIGSDLEERAAKLGSDSCTGIARRLEIALDAMRVLNPQKARSVGRGISAVAGRTATFWDGEVQRQGRLSFRLLRGETLYSVNVIHP